MSKEHHIFMFPGLGDRPPGFLLNTLLKRFEKFGYVTHMGYVDWKGDQESFEATKQQYVTQIHKLALNGTTITLMGTSAGRIFTHHIYSETRDKVSSVIGIAGRIRKGRGVFPPLSWAAASWPIFYKAVIEGEQRIQPTFTNIDLEKFQNFTPVFDPVVPPSTMFLEGATNIRVPFVEHRLAILATLFFYRNPMSRFIESGRQR